MNAVAEVATDPKPAVRALEGELLILENRMAMNYETGGRPLAIVSTEHYRDVAQELAKAKELSRQIEAKRLEMTRPLDAAKANIKSFFDKLRERPDSIARRITVALDKWDDDQRRAAAEAQRKLDEETERQRRFNEQRAARAVERGEFDKAAEIQAEPPPPAPVVAPKIPDVRGVTVKTNWKYRIVDASLLPREYLKPDDAAIGAMVRAKKKETAIPGVEVYSDTTRY